MPEGLTTVNDPTAQRTSIDLTEEEVRAVSPQMSDTKVNRLVQAASEFSFGRSEGISEQFILDKQYKQAATYIFNELGPVHLDAFVNAQEVVYAAALDLLKDRTSTTGTIKSVAHADTNDDFILRPLIPQSVGGSATDFTFATGTTGEFDIIPGFGGAASAGSYSVTNNQQTVLFFGVSESLNDTVLQSVAYSTDDGESGRLGEFIAKQMTGGTAQIAELENVYWGPDNEDIKVTGVATSDSTIEFPLIGVEVTDATRVSDEHSTLFSEF